MRILHTIDTGGMYGKERMLLALIRKQVDDLHTVSVAGFGTDDFFTEAKLIANGGITHYRSISDFKNQLGSLPEYNVIHTHDMKTGVLLALWNCFHLNHQTKVIRTVHGYCGIGKPWYSKSKLYEFIDKLMLHFNTVNVGVSEDLATQLGAELVHNGIEPFDFNTEGDELRSDVVDFCNESIDDLPKSFVFCCMARLSHEKNLEALIEAILQVRGAKLLLIGDGPLMADLQKRVEYYPEKVLLTGFLKDSKDYLMLVDAYIQPSLTEGMPISVLEAMSAGIPLMTSKVGGMKILHETGAAVNSDTNPNFMAGNMNIFISQKWKQNSTVEKGTKLFNEQFSSDSMYENYRKLYDGAK